jgi:lipopolysaccharide transport system permease protein
MSKNHYLELIFFKTYADLRAEAARTYINFLWWIIEPLLYMSVFYIVFGLLFQRGGDDFVPFLLCGLTVWKWFDSTLRNGAVSINANNNLMQQVYLPKIIFPSITIATNTIKFAFVLAMLLLFLWWSELDISVHYLALPIVLGVQFLFILACTYLAAAVVPLLPDIKLLIDNGLTLLFFLSGIFFAGNTIPERYQFYFYLNPMASLIESYRDILLYRHWPDWQHLSFIILLSLAGIYFAHRLLTRFDRIYPRTLMV